MKKIRLAIAVFLIRIAMRIDPYTINFRLNADELHSKAWEWEHDIDQPYKLEVATKTLENLSYELDNLAFFIADTFQTHDRFQRNPIKNFLSLFRGLMTDRLFLESENNRIRRTWGRK
jgi:hypothetical protein